MESFLVAVNAVIPFFCYLALGYTMKIRGVVKEEFLQKLNQMVFRVFYPFMTFYNIYKADAESLPRPLLLIFTGASILIVEALLIVIIPKIVKENPRRGVIIQAIFRSNFVLFGLPLTIAVFGDSAASIAAMMVTVVVSIYNTTSVFILEMFNGEGKSDIKKTLKAVATNPLLQGAIVGLIFFFLGIKLPGSLVTPIAAFSNMTSPLAIYVLGGTLQFKAIRKNLKYLVPTLTCKLFFLPAIIIAIAVKFLLDRTTFGYELKACGANRHAAKYAGINDKKNIILSMVIAGGLSGSAAALYWLSGHTEFYWSTYQALPAVGFNGIPVALLAANNPIAVIFSGCFMSILNIAGMQLKTLTAYNEYITDIIIATIVYLSAFSMMIKTIINNVQKKKSEKGGEK